jgi:PHP family Zn ribbon phosphoesterase
MWLANYGSWGYEGLSGLKTYRADLHVHTVLSPCADVEMIPPLIVQEALEKGISLIAITDHNATANIEAVQKAASGSELVVLPGMELQTKEEVHVLCLFDTLAQAQELQQLVDKVLPDIKNKADYFGEQFVVDETGDFISSEERLLLTSADITLKDAWKEVTRIGGLFVPAHVNRQAFGLIANLGFVPEDINIEALEISRHITPEEAIKKYPQIGGYPLMQNGDVHRLNEYLGSNEYRLDGPTITEIRKALVGNEGRSIRYR